MKTRIIAVMAAITVLLVACGGSGSDSSSDELRIVASPGTSAESIEAGYGEPFTEETGAKLVIESPPDLGKLKAMVESGNVTANLYELSGPAMESAHTQGLIEDLDWDAIDADPMIEGTELPYAFGYQTFSVYMAGRADVEPVTTWEEFWDVDRQPGMRALPAFARFILPAALMADGVDRDDLYPLDIDRALESIDRIKDDLILWESASQVPQMLDSKEVVYAGTYDNVFPEDGYQVSYDEGLVYISYFVVPKGAKNVDLSMKLLHQMSKVDNQVKAAEVIPVAGPSPDLIPLLGEDILSRLSVTPELREKSQVENDSTWWAEHGPEAEAAWDEYLLENF